MKAASTLIIGMTTLFLSAFAQDGATHRYFVPFPGTQSVASVDWTIDLEVTPRVSGEYRITIIQHDSRGGVQNVVDYGLQPSHGVFRWNSAEGVNSRRVRSISILSDVPLCGQIWMSNEVHEQLNGAVLAASPEASLTIPYIPELYFEMTTSFSVQGYSASGVSSAVEFLLYDENRNLQEPFVLRSNLASNGYQIATPEVTLSLSGLDDVVVPSWAILRTSNPEYGLAGFQTFSRDNPDTGLNESAANNLSAAGAASGHILFFESDELLEDGEEPFDGVDGALPETLPTEHTLIFVNPTNQTAVVDLELFTPRFSEELQADYLTSIEDRLRLEPYERRIVVFGRDIFEGFEGVPHRLSYQAHTEPAEVSDSVQGLDIFALHFRGHPNSGALAAAGFAPSGNLVHGILTLNERFTSELVFASLGKHRLVYDPEDPESLPIQEIDSSEIQISIFGSQQGPSTANWVVDAGEFRNISAEDILEVFQLGEEASVMIEISVVEGPDVTAHLVARGPRDIGLINPSIEKVVHEEPVDPDGDSDAGDSGDAVNLGGEGGLGK
jgi:hypothetical protein